MDKENGVYANLCNIQTFDKGDEEEVNKRLWLEIHTLSFINYKLYYIRQNFLGILCSKVVF